MSKTNFADPNDDFDAEFIKWVAELLQEYNDDESNLYESHEDYEIRWINDLKKGDFYD